MASSGSYDGYFIGDGEQQPTNWTLGPIIANGRFAKISHVARGPLSPMKCAVKQSIIPDDIDEKTRKSIDDEIRLLKKVKHHRINDYFGFSRTKRTLSLFMAYMEKGTLADFMKNQEHHRLSEKKTALFVYQILEGLEYLHKMRIIHRDIKGSNILMQDDYNIKISDFGVSKILNTISRAGTQRKGTLNWMAPEVLQSNPSYSYPIDIWSLGCTVYQLITGEIPFSEKEEFDMIYDARQNQLELLIPEHCSPNLKHFLSLACKQKAEDRPKAGELKKHVFLIDNIDETSVMKAAEHNSDLVEQDVTDRQSLPSGPISGYGYPPPGASGFSLGTEMDGVEWHATASVLQNNFPTDELDSVQIPKNVEWKAKLTASFDSIVKEVDPEHILPKLFEEFIINLDEKEELEHQPRKQCVNKLLGIILRKPESVCAKFVEILKGENYTHLYDIIKNKEIKRQEEKHPASWFDELPDATKNKVITEIDASRLATIIGKNCENVLYNLGLRKAEIDQEFQSNGSNTQRTLTNMLIKWKQRNGKNATFSSVMKTLLESEKKNDVYIDWERAKTFF